MSEVLRVALDGYSPLRTARRVSWHVHPFRAFIIENRQLERLRYDAVVFTNARHARLEMSGGLLHPPVIPVAEPPAQDVVIDDWLLMQRVGSLVERGFHSEMLRDYSGRILVFPDSEEPEAIRKHVPALDFQLELIDFGLDQAASEWENSETQLKFIDMSRNMDREELYRRAAKDVFDSVASPKFGGLGEQIARLAHQVSEAEKNLTEKLGEKLDELLRRRNSTP